MSATGLSSGSSPPGLIIAAPASGSGKTTVSLALMRAFHRSGLRVAPAKVGPDYIDPGFHRAACGRASPNLDPWAMRPETRAALIGDLAVDTDLILAEGAMGLFDGAADGTGSTADLAAETGWSVLLVVDVTGQAASAAAVVRGFAGHRADVRIAGILFNRVGAGRHGAMLTRAMTQSDPGVPVLGQLPRAEGLALDSRHLGLVQAQEREDLAVLLDRAADWIAGHADLDGIRAAAATGRVMAEAVGYQGLDPIGQCIAVARDAAFDFAYPHLLESWHRAGAEILPFSPLADEAPAARADAVFLPGGYPELHAGRLAGNAQFLDGLRHAAAGGARLYGECGGFMVLGDSLTDAAGQTHRMAGLLPLATSFATRRLHLGYRRITVLADTAPWPRGTRLTGHEFHYTTILTQGPALPLFQAEDALGDNPGPVGLVSGRVCGSFLHLIDEAS